MLYGFDDYVFDTERRELWRGATAVAVEPQVFDLLAYLIENRDRVVSKEDLRAAVWQGRIVSESTLSSAINAARTAIGDTGEEQRLIRTLPRKGFRFVGALHEGAPPTTVGPGALVPPAPLGQPSASGGLALRARRITVPVMSVAAVAALAATLGYLLWSAPNGSQSVTSERRFDAASVPLVDDEARRTLASYPTRPDFKALAITGGGMAIADGQPNAEAAKRDALQRCNVRTKRQCRLYAVGMDIVWSKEALPLPAPDDLRFEPLDAPLVPDEIPMLNRDRRETIARVHMNAPNHRALALATNEAWTMSGRGSRTEAARLALERCAEYFQRHCLLLSVDGLLTMRIPKSRQVIRIFLPSIEPEIPAREKARIGLIYRGADWRALATGKNGSWHAVADAPSEAAAIEIALNSCARADAQCRLYAIGNFRVAGE